MNEKIKMKVLADLEVDWKIQDYARGMGKSQIHQYAQMFNRLHRPPLLPLQEFRWNQAFVTVLGVGTKFYQDAPAERKRFLEAHYTELAEHDTRRGRKAAKVVARFVQAVLGEEPQPSSGTMVDIEDRILKQEIQQKQRMLDTRIFGAKASYVVVDEVTGVYDGVTFHETPKEK